MSWDPVWEEVFITQSWGKYPGEDLIRFIARNFYKSPDRREIKILEVGCGPGANLWYMAREGFSVYGVDGSETAIAQAKERLDREAPNWQGELLVGDISRLPYSDSFFDAAVDNEAICCNSYENSKIIYKELARVMKKNGKLFSRTFARGCWGDGTGKDVGLNAWIVDEGPLYKKGIVRFTDYSEIADLLEDFKVNEIELLTRTMEDRKHEVREWVIVSEKA